MGYATVSKFVRNLIEGKLSIYQPFFYFFNFLQNKKLLNRNTLYLGKEAGYD